MVDTMTTADSRSRLHRAQLFLIALWGEGLSVSPAPAEGARTPQLRGGTRFLLPEPESALIARAAAAHAGAHWTFSERRFSGHDLKARQRALIELIEDARVEALAIERYPGLRLLWRDQLPPPEHEVYDFDHLAGRLAHALLDPAYQDQDAWITRGQAAFFDARGRWSDAGLSWELGMWLASDLGQMRIAMNEGRAFSVADYRDDNAHLWEDERSLAPETETAAADSIESMGLHSARLREDDVGAVLALADASDQQEGRGFEVAQTGQAAALEYRGEESLPSPTPMRVYPEWDYRIQRLRTNWVTVCEREPAAGDPSLAERALLAHRQVVERLHRQIAAVRYESRRRLRRQLEGDELDMDGLVANAIALRGHQTPDQRIHVRHHIHSEQELALLVLLDLSASTNDRVAGAGARTVLDITRDAAIVLSDALSRLGHRFAIHGFNSDGRHALHYQRLVDFGEPFGAVQRARFGAVRGEYSTRMGAAVRHATRCLASQPAEHRLLLVITDGEPSDVDVHDRRLLVEDARHAVFDASAVGVVPFCLSLDTAADDYVAHIFGPARFAMLDDVTALPRQLPSIYFRLARRYLV